MYDSHFEQTVLHLCDEYNLDLSVSNRVKAHFEHIWSRTQGTNAHELFQALSPALRSDLNLSMYLTLCVSFVLMFSAILRLF